MSRVDHSTHGIEAPQDNDDKEDKDDSDKDDNDDNDENEDKGRFSRPVTSNNFSSYQFARSSQQLAVRSQQFTLSS